MGISEPMHHTGPGTGRNKSLESHPIDFEDDDQSGFFCRICWYEEDEDEGMHACYEKPDRFCPNAPYCSFHL